MKAVEVVSATREALLPHSLPVPARDILTAIDGNAQYTHVLCIMATKTISLRVEAYERLRRARSRPNESFSDVVMRATWDEQTVTGGELLLLVRERGTLYDADELDTIEQMKSEGSPPADKWSIR